MLIAIVSVAAFLQHSTINKIASLFLANSTSLYKMHSNSLVYFQFQLRNLSLLYNCTEVKIIGKVSFFNSTSKTSYKVRQLIFGAKIQILGKLAFENFLIFSSV